MTLMLLAAQLLSPNAHAATVDVEIFDNGFRPKHVTIDEGDTVRWTWTGNRAHDVQAAAGQMESFRSPLQASGTFEFVFGQGGAVNYFCGPHGDDAGGGNVTGMSGSVTVIPAAGPAAEVTGACPGQVSIVMSGGTPGGNFALLTGTAQGSAPIPGGPCAGVPTNLGNITFRGLFPADAAGTRVMTPTLPGGACGLFLQALDVDTCEMTNLTVIPF